MDLFPISRPPSAFVSVNFQLHLKSENVGATHPDQPLATPPDVTVGEAIELLRAQRAGAVLVCDGTKLVGIFTERDALHVMAKGTDLATPLQDIMSTDVSTLSPTATVAEAIQKMSQGGYRHLPIVDESGKPTGVVGVGGIMHYMVEHFPNTIYNLPPHPNATPSQREGA